MAAIFYSDTLYGDALIRDIRAAKSSIMIMVFLMKTGYAQRTLPDEVADELIAARNRGVEVFIILNYSRFESSVAAENWATAAKLSAGGCTVRMGPRNQTLHTKMAIFDMAKVYIGSHNITRGGLGFNLEVTALHTTKGMLLRAVPYFNYVWEKSTRFEETPAPVTGVTPVAITLDGIQTVGTEIELTFTVNHTTGVDAFVAVADNALNLRTATLGATVTPETRVARVTPTVEPGEMVFLAVRAYYQGDVVATSNSHSMVYQPGETEGGGGDEGGGGEPPAPEPLTAPHLESIVAGLGGTEMTATWTFAGCENFHRFEIQKRDAQLNWNTVAAVMDPNARQWVGPGPGTIEPTTYRVVVFNMAEESAASNEITITGEPPVSLQPPVLVSVTQIGPMGINVEYSHVTPAEFARYEVQQRTNETWNTLATITTPETRSWSGGPIPYMDVSHPVRVVVFVQSGDSAASNEMAITPM